jgi:hypothetical protein
MNKRIRKKRAKQNWVKYYERFEKPLLNVNFDLGAPLETFGTIEVKWNHPERSDMFESVKNHNSINRSPVFTCAIENHYLNGKTLEERNELLNGRWGDWNDM